MSLRRTVQRNRRSRSRSPILRTSWSNDHWSDPTWTSAAWSSWSSWKSEENTVQSTSHHKSEEQHTDSTTSSVNQHLPISQSTTVPTTHPSTWKSDDNHWDCTVVHGFTLPKLVASNQFTRQQGIAGVPIMDLRLYQCIPFGLDSWLLRYMANGRFLQFEGFRSKKEAIVCTSLCKLIRDNPQVVDLEVLAANWATQNNVQFTTWDEKQNAYQGIATQLFQTLREMMPSKPSSSADNRIKELEAEVASLRAQQQKSPINVTAPSSSASTSGQQRQNLSPIAQALKRSTSQMEHTTNTTSLQDHPWERNNRKKILSNNAPASHSKASVTAWISKLKLSPVATSTFQEMIAKLQEFQSEPIATPLADVAADWGMPVSLACKMSDSDLTRCIAAAVTMAK